MKTIKTILLLSFTILTCEGYGQLNYLGLNNILSSDNLHQLLPEMQVIDGYVYVPTGKGIYRKNLSTLSDTAWELFAFPNVPIRGFVKKGDSILAITSYSEDSLLLLSNDNGNSYINYTNEHFLEYEDFNTLHRIAQNRQNPSSIIVQQDHYGVSESKDFGLSWNHLNAWSGGFQERFVGFHPNDSLALYYTGETSFYSSYTQMSLDGGQTWSLNQAIDNNCTHYLAFHPLDPDIILAGQEGRISRSEDRGLTWETPYSLSEYLYVYKILFDENNPGIAYATGAFNSSENDHAVIYKSIDNDNSWTRWSKQELQDCGGVLDMVQYQDKLILLTFLKGVYVLDINASSTQDNPVLQNFHVYPNPANSFVYFSRLDQLKSIQITDVAGKVIKSYPAVHSDRIDVSGIAKGAYLISFYMNRGAVTRKITIQ